MHHEQWANTRDTREAAAFGTLGMPIRLSTTFVVKKGQRVTRFFLGLQSVDGIYQTGKIRNRIKTGKLESEEPAHPFLTILRGFENRDRILDCANKGARIRLVEVPGAPGIWQYVASDSGLPGISGQIAVMTTGDLKMAAALGVVGLPVLKIEGEGGSRKFYLPRIAPVRAGEPPIDGYALMSAWREDKASIPWRHPFAQAARGLYNRERLLDAINSDVELILIEKPNSANHRSATVRADLPQNGAAWDAVKRHFDS